MYTLSMSLVFSCVDWAGRNFSLALTCLSSISWHHKRQFSPPCIHPCSWLWCSIMEKILTTQSSLKGYNLTRVWIHHKKKGLLWKKAICLLMQHYKFFALIDRLNHFCIDQNFFMVHYLYLIPRGSIVHLFFKKNVVFPSALCILYVIFLCPIF